jgi:hypothetical protein
MTIFSKNKGGVFSTRTQDLKNEENLGPVERWRKISLTYADFETVNDTRAEKVLPKFLPAGAIITGLKVALIETFDANAGLDHCEMYILDANGTNYLSGGLSSESGTSGLSLTTAADGVHGYQLPSGNGFLPTQLVLEDMIPNHNEATDVTIGISHLSADVVVNALLDMNAGKVDVFIKYVVLK